MIRSLRIAGVLFVALALVLALAVGGLYFTSQLAPDFYHQAVAVEPQAQRTASDEALANASALASRVQKAGRWEALFTAEQINGWLAVDLVENHPRLLPPEVGNPRVEIVPGRLHLAFQYASGGLSSVVSLGLEVFVAEKGCLAVKLAALNAGRLPLPMGWLVEEISSAAAEAGWPLNWTTNHAAPVALVPLDGRRDSGKACWTIDTVELRDGAIYVAGTTQAAGSFEAALPDTADQRWRNANSQR